MASITLIQGDSINEIIAITDKDNEIIDISGGTIKFRIVENVDDLKATAIYNNDNVPITNGPLGQATLTVTRDVSKLWLRGKHHWEVEYIDSASNFSHTPFSQCEIVKSIYSKD